MNNTILSTVQLTKYFGDFIAFENANIELKENEIIGIVGENGAGKSFKMFKWFTSTRQR